MVRLSFALLASSLLASVYGQDELPALPQSASPQGGSCGGCYVVADVAAVVFGSEYLIQEDTEVIQIQTGRNGSSYTSTSIIIGTGRLSISTQGAFGGSTAAVTINNGPTLVVNGATLTSPTAYQVFTAYSITESKFDENSICRTTSYDAVTPPSPFSIAIPQSPDVDFISKAEQSFIDSIGLSCSAAGVSISSTSVFSGTVLTSTSTSIGPLRFTPQPVSVIGSVVTPTVTLIGTGTSSNFTLVQPSYSVMPGAGSSLFSEFHGSTLPLMIVGAVTVLIAALAL